MKRKYNKYICKLERGRRTRRENCKKKIQFKKIFNTSQHAFRRYFSHVPTAAKPAELPEETDTDSYQGDGKDKIQ